MLMAGAVPQLDPLVAAFAATTGATDLSGLDALIRYVRGEGLIANFRIFPFKAAQNAGSGATVYGIGGLTSNDVSLFSSPTWQSDGIDLDGVGYGRVYLSGFRSWTEGHVWTRLKPSYASATDGGFYTRWWFGSSDEYLASSTNTAYLSGERYCTYQRAGRTGSSTASWSAGEDFCEVCRFGTFPSTASVKKNAVAFTMDKTIANQYFYPASISWTADDFIWFATTYLGSPSPQNLGVVSAYAFCDVGLTSTQEDAITDLINAL